MLRRSFLISSAAAVAASDKVNIVLFGCGRQGPRLAASLGSMPDVNLAAVCDVDESQYKKAMEWIEPRVGRRPPLIKEIRRVLDDKSVDAVINALPDHWHAPGSILACSAGKDVYTEKPLSHNLREGRLLVEAARRHNRIVQVGLQGRSRPSTIQAIEIVRAGKLGSVRMAKAWNVQLRDNIGHVADGAPPPGVDYDSWVGPAPMVPFRANRFHYNWHWTWNFGTGDMGNDGVHQLDMARWALGVETPDEASGFGGKMFFDDDQETPDTMNISYRYPGKAIQFEMRIWNPYGMEGQQNGVAVYGSEGTLHIGRWPNLWGYRTYDAKGKLVPELSAEDKGGETNHHRNFIDCIKSRKQPNAPPELAHASTTLCHLGNIVAKVSRTIRFDGKSESIAGDAAAHALLRRQYRQHWSVPKGA